MVSISRLSADCLRIIFIQLQYDPCSLYSCILVNRSWCQVAVPILWKHPYIFNKTISQKLFDTVINNLPTSSKQLLSDNDVKLSFSKFSNKPLFNYIEFSTEIPSDFIIKMVRTLIKEDEFDKKDLLEQEIYKLFIKDCRSIKYFDWKTKQPLSRYPRASTCFSRLRDLVIDLGKVTSTTLYEMAEFCQNIKDLKIWFCDGDIPGLIKFIDNQKNLESLFINFKNLKKRCIQLSEVIERRASKIKTITINQDVKRFSPISPKFLLSLTNLESLELDRIGLCTKEMDEWNKYITISSFPNLQYVKIASIHTCKDYMIIENSHGSILEMELFRKYRPDPVHTEKLFKAIALHCPKIERLTLDAELEHLDSIKEILLNCLQLREVYFTSINNEELCGDELLDILAEYSPKNLHVFNFDGWIFTSEAVMDFCDNYNGDMPIEFIYED